MSDTLDENVETTNPETETTHGSGETVGTESTDTGVPTEEIPIVDVDIEDEFGAGELGDLILPIPVPSTGFNQEGIKYSVALKPLDNIKALLKEVGYTDTFLNMAEAAYPKFNGMPTSAPSTEKLTRGFYDTIRVEVIPMEEFSSNPELVNFDYTGRITLTFPNSIRKLFTNLEDLSPQDITVPPLTHESDPSHVVYEGFEGFQVTHLFNVIDFLREVSMHSVFVPEYKTDYDAQNMLEIINGELSKYSLQGLTQNEGGVFKTKGNFYLNNHADDVATLFPFYEVEGPSESELVYGSNHVTMKPLPNHYFNLVAKDSTLEVVKMLDLDNQEVRRIVGFKPIFAGEEYDNIPNIDNSSYFKPQLAKQVPVTFFDINDDVVVSELGERELNAGRVFATLINEQYTGARKAFFEKVLPTTIQRTGEGDSTVTEFNYNVINEQVLAVKSSGGFISQYFDSDAIKALETRLKVPYVDFNMVGLNKSLFMEMIMPPLGDVGFGIPFINYIKEEGRAVSGEGGFPIVPINLTTYPKLISEHITNNQETYAGTSLEGLDVSVSEVIIEKDNRESFINKSVTVLTLSGTSIVDKDSATQVLDKFFEHFNSKHYLDTYAARNSSVISIRNGNGYTNIDKHTVTVDTEGEGFVQSLVTNKEDSYFSAGEFIVRVSYAPEKVTPQPRTMSFADDGTGRILEHPYNPGTNTIIPR